MREELYNVKLAYEYFVVARNEEEAKSLAEEKLSECNRSDWTCGDEHLVISRMDFDSEGIEYTETLHSPYVRKESVMYDDHMECGEGPSVLRFKGLLDLDKSILTALENPSKYPINDNLEPEPSELLGVIERLFDKTDGLEATLQDYLFLRFPDVMSLWFQRGFDRMHQEHIVDTIAEELEESNPSEQAGGDQPPTQSRQVKD